MRSRVHEASHAGAARRTGTRAGAALTVLAAAAVGWGGALLALVWRLRLSAWEGRETVPWTAPALAVVGLLVGCWLGGRVPTDGLGRPARWTAQAGLLLCLGALAAVTADLVVAPPSPPPAGLLAWALAVPAACWGAAAVRVLQAWGGPARSPWLLAAALLGAGLAFLLGPGLLAGEGLTTGQRQAGAAGLLAAFLLLSIPPSWSRAQLRAPDPDAPRVGGAVAAGLLVALVWSWLLPRVDLLWGFSSGPLRMPVAALFTAAFGCAALTPLLRRMWGDAAPGWSGLLAVAVLALGLQEHLAPGGPSAPATGGWRQAVALALPAALVGALPALVLARPRLGPAALRRLVTGMLIGFALGHGALLEIVPRAWPDQGVQVVALAAPPLAALLLVRATALAIPAALAVAGWGLLGLGGQPSPWEDAPATVEWAGTRRVVARAPKTQVEYDRGRQELVLRTGRDVLDRWGPDARAALLAGNLPRLLRPAARRVIVLGLGNGRAAAALARGGAVECWEPRAGVPVLQPALAADGPVPATAPLAVVTQAVGMRAALHELEDGSVDLLVPGAPASTAEPWLATEDFHRLARHVLGDGLLVRTIYVPRTPADLVECELTAASRAHPHVAVLLVRETAVLLASGTPIPAGRADWDARLRSAPEPARRALHRAGIAGGEDLVHAVLFHVRGPLPGVCWRDDDLAAALLLNGALGVADARASWSVLSAALAASGGTDLARQRLLLRTAEGEDLEELLVQWSGRRRAAPDSQLIYEDEVEARLRLDTATVTALAGAEVPGGGPLAAALSAKWRGRACPEPVLQAALGLTDRRGISLVEPAIAGRNAVALDPTFFARAPARLRELAPKEPHRSPLEDLSVLPQGGGLVAAATGDSAMAVALRARFRIECAHALVDAMAQRSLQPAEQTALGQVLDPTSLRSAVRTASAAGRLDEALAVWRADLSMPAELETALRGPAVLRQALAAALGGRGDSRSIDALAALLTDAEAEVRVAAGAALYRTVGERIPFDPQWAESRLQQAADRLKALHNRNP